MLQVITALDNLVQADKDSSDAADVVDLMYHTALLTSGFDVESPKDYAQQVYSMMGAALGQNVSEAGVSRNDTSSNGKHAGSGQPEAIQPDAVIEEK